ncbi:MAG: alginate export family protein [Pseudomonadota bacterium]
MMMPRFALSLSSLALMTASPALAGDGLKLSGQMRLRYESIDGQARTGFDSSDTLFSMRTQVSAEYDAKPLRFGVDLFDSRAYGAGPGTPLSTNEVNALELVQAYVAGTIDRPFGKGTSLSLTGGRMMLNLGSRRIVAADDYRNTTNSYTGLRADLAAPKGVKATVIYSLPQMRRPDDAGSLRDNRPKIDRESFDAVLWGGMVSRAHMLGRALLEVSFFHFGERDSPRLATRDRSIDVFGGRVFAEPKPGALDYEVEMLGQRGSISRSLAAGADKQAVRASFVHADIGYSFISAWTPRLSLEFDRASGDRAGGRYGRFDPLFGMRRADLAPSGIYNAITRTNIVTPGIRFEAVPSDRLDWFAVYRPMWLAAADDSFATTGVRDATGRSGDFAGHQIEARLRYWLVPKRLRCEFDGVLLAKSDFLRRAPNATPRRWTRYGSFNLTASL